MKKILPFIVYLLVIHFHTNATHIVGGELMLRHIPNVMGGSSNLYALDMVMYFDDVNGNPDALDPDVQVHIFAQSTDRLVNSYTLPLLSNTFVSYTNPECTNPILRTRKLSYGLSINMPAATYNDPLGYYIVYDRCCRNNIIQNIVSPESAGQLFYLEIPPVVKNGKPLVNSSPVLFPPLSDYACLNRTFSFDFSGTDLDGDSLVYSLATPLNGHSSPDPGFIIPPATPAPYPEITFSPSHDVNNMVRGDPSLSIDSNTGFLTVTPSEEGLFVFTVKCEEFRNGVKIGEVRRDFQMIVLDCPPAAKPQIQVLHQGVEYVEGNIITLYEGVADQCLEVRGLDNDADSKLFLETLLDGMPNFKDFIVSGDVNVTIQPGEVANFRLCLNTNNCLEKTNQVYELNVLLGDNTCAKPLYDTATVLINAVSLPNNPPLISSSLSYNSLEQRYEARIPTDEVFELNVQVTDADADDVLVFPNPAIFDLETINFPNDTLVKTAPMDTLYRWTPSCLLLSHPSEERNIDLMFITSDLSVKCDKSAYDTMQVRLTVFNKPNPNNAPTTTNDILNFNSSLKMFYDTITIGENYSTTFSTADPNNDSVSISFEGVGFDENAVRARFTGFSQPLPVLSEATFTWSPGCDVLDIENGILSQNYAFNIYTTDSRLCDVPLSDTVVFNVLVIIDGTNSPLIRPDLTYNPTTYSYEAKVEAETSFTMDFLITDADNDLVYFKAMGVGFDLADIEFSSKTFTGTVPLNISYLWQPSCILLGNFEKDKDFEIDFIAFDTRDKCEPIFSDTVRVKLTLFYDLPENNAPIVSNSTLVFNAENKVFYDTLYLGQKYNTTFTIDDTEADKVRVSAAGIGYEMADLNMYFDTGSQNNLTPFQAKFTWTPNCDILNFAAGETQRNYPFQIYTLDTKDCNNALSDTFTVNLLVMLKPNNNPPTLHFPTLIYEPESDIFIAESVVKQRLFFDVIGKDKDNNTIEITAQGDGFNLNDLNMNFPRVSGYGTVRSIFNWLPQCEMLDKTSNANRYKVQFFIKEIPACGQPSIDTVGVQITLDNITRNTTQDYPNAFTPNGDTFNNTFCLDNIPSDICSDKFLYIVIVNRWGKEVFRSEKRNFQWAGEASSEGVYFYTLIYERSAFKGTVQLLR